MTIEEEFDRIIPDIFPDKNGGCSLTFKKRRQFKTFFFLGWRAALTTTMVAAENQEEEAAKVMEERFAEVTKYFEAEEHEQPATRA